MNVEAAISTGSRVRGADDQSYPVADVLLDDCQLVAAARVDPQAFALLYRRYVRPLYQYLYHRVGNPQEAEDLTASTFGKALAGIERYHEQGSFPAWLFGIARHTLQDYQRHRRPAVDVAAVAGALVDPAASPESQALQAEEAHLLRRLVDQLPADQQEAVMLRYFGGLATADIAVLLRRREGAVRALLHRAIVALREAYRREVSE
jgi:RNA polymerase sigma-70 factor (ECF subfamily)